ncbi:succinate dehydrogenase assembly factor 4, mitochondrial-like isoform X2 [Phymastichus coffea]|uniref:succinate dehydrogenase assembly factor 4, mitochondrial-like isoform X2 n=1 Tax=Phymastichus coffea TaxID=108790 RepID=UPI00273C131B|nr:succinate dehydrogenase assembly factor 4, mitochondrial-like isoform X2 [Phymastichus coffea]
MNLPRNVESPVYVKQKSESERMKRFQEKMKLEKISRVQPGMRFVDLVLVDTNPNDGELISNSERNPTKYGDWQHNGRVTDF